MKYLKILLLALVVSLGSQAQTIVNPETFPQVTPTLSDFVYSNTGGSSKKISIADILALDEFGGQVTDTVKVVTGGFPVQIGDTTGTGLGLPKSGIILDGEIFGVSQGTAILQRAGQVIGVFVMGELYPLGMQGDGIFINAFHAEDWGSANIRAVVDTATGSPLFFLVAESDTGIANAAVVLVGETNQGAAQAQARMLSIVDSEGTGNSLVEVLAQNKSLLPPDVASSVRTIVGTDVSLNPSALYNEISVAMANNLGPGGTWAIQLIDSSRIQIGRSGSSEYNLPTTRGSADDVLRNEGGATVTWDYVPDYDNIAQVGPGVYNSTTADHRLIYPTTLGGNADTLYLADLEAANGDNGFTVSFQNGDLFNGFILAPSGDDSINVSGGFYSVGPVGSSGYRRAWFYNDIWYLE